MGFYLRKSVRVGPVRFNLSKSGIGMSTGIKGFRVGTGDLRAVAQQSLALHAARTALLRVQAERLVQRVNLHLALGGGF